MKNTCSLDQIQETSGLTAGLKMRQYKLDTMEKFMEIKSNNPKLKQSGIAKNYWNYHLLQYNGIEEKKICFHLIGYHHHLKPIKENKKYQTRTLMMLR